MTTWHAMGCEDERFRDYTAQGDDAEAITRELESKLEEAGYAGQFHFEVFTDEIHVYDMTVDGWDTFEPDEDTGETPGLWMSLHAE